MIVVDDPIAKERCYVRDDGVRAPTLWALTRASDAVDETGIAIAMGLAPWGPESCVRGIRHAPIGPLSGESCELFPVLVDAVRAAVAKDDASLALSGGVDSALIVAMIRHLDLQMPRLVTLRTRFANYDEVEQAQSVARAFGVSCEVLDVTDADYDAALPAVIEAVAQPLYNLHPVSRWLLAKRLGCRTLITGDGADQVLCGTASALYVPLIHAICASCDVELASPFFARSAAFVPRDPNKRAMRELAHRLGVPESIAFAPKRGRLTPHDPATTRRRTRALFVQRLRRS